MSDLDYERVVVQGAKAEVYHTKSRPASITITLDPQSKREEFVVRRSLHTEDGTFVKMGPNQKYDQRDKIPAALQTMVDDIRAQVNVEHGKEQAALKALLAERG